MKKTLILLLSIISYQSFSQVNSIVSNHFWGGNTAEYYGGSILLNNDDIISVSGSNSVISGNKDSAAYGLGDTWVVSYDQNYNKNWEQVLGGDQYEGNRNVAHFNNEIIISMTSASSLSGKRTTMKKGLYDALVYNIDPSGNITWEKSFGTSLGTTFHSSTFDSMGNIYLACESSSDISIDKSENSFG